ncbi:MAG: hypothetical protein V4510_12845 [bacterium]
MTIIGITGYAQHGKDSLATGLGLVGYERIGFADALKAMALDVDPIIYVPLASNTVTRLSELVGRMGWEEAKQYAEVRRFLQQLGTRAREHLGPDVWVQALERRWLESGITNLVVPDVRFPNEAEWIHRHSGVMVRVNRPDFDNGVGTDHPSEKFVPTLPVDFEYVVPTGQKHLFTMIAKALANGLNASA